MSAAQRAEAERLLAALSDLLAREAVAARQGSGLAVRAVQVRIAPLISRLVQLAEGGSDAGLATACAEIRRRREDIQRLLEAARDRLRAEIALKTACLGRLRQVAPAYGPQRRVAACLDVAR